MQKIILLLFYSPYRYHIDNVCDSSYSEKLAAKELKRYIFLRTGIAPSLTTSDNYIGLTLL